MNKIKVLIVDDEALIRDGLKIILNSYDDIDVVETAENGQVALEICKKLSVDIILMDIRMPICDGVLGTKMIKSQFTNIQILILTTFDDDKYILDALNNGASGYLLKDSSYDIIHNTIKTTYSGNIVIHPKVASKLISQTSISSKSIDENVNYISKEYSLTKREMSIIKGVAEGLSNQEIADLLFLSLGTIKNNLTNILSKLSLRDRTQLAIFAFKNNMVE